MKFKKKYVKVTNIYNKNETSIHQITFITEQTVKGFASLKTKQVKISR